MIKITNIVLSISHCKKITAVITSYLLKKIYIIPISLLLDKIKFFRKITIYYVFVGD